MAVIKKLVLQLTSIPLLNTTLNILKTIIFVKFYHCKPTKIVLITKLIYVSSYNMNLSTLESIGVIESYWPEFPTSTIS